MSYLPIERPAEKIDCTFSMPISMPTDRKEQPPMTKPREKTHKELTAEIEEDEKKKIRQFKQFFICRRASDSSLFTVDGLR